MELTTEERSLTCDALRDYANNLSEFVARIRTDSAKARLEERIELLRNLADRFEHKAKERGG